MAHAARALVTEAEFLALPESMDKVELIDGEINVSPSPAYRHQEVLRRLLLALGNWAAGRSGPITIGQSPLDVRIAANRILQPDAFVLFAHVPSDHRGPIDAVPELCVEVLSTDRIHDRVTKRLLYAAAGVREYWVVELSGVIERWTGPGLTLAEEIRDRVRSPLLPDFELDLAKLFA